MPESNGCCVSVTCSDGSRPLLADTLESCPGGYSFNQITKTCCPIFCPSNTGRAKPAIQTRCINSEGGQHGVCFPVSIGDLIFSSFACEIGQYLYQVDNGPEKSKQVCCPIYCSNASNTLVLRPLTNEGECPYSTKYDAQGHACCGPLLCPNPIVDNVEFFVDESPVDFLSPFGTKKCPIAHFYSPTANGCCQYRCEVSGLPPISFSDPDNFECPINYENISTDLNLPEGLQLDKKCCPKKLNLVPCPSTGELPIPYLSTGQCREGHYDIGNLQGCCQCCRSPNPVYSPPLNEWPRCRFREYYIETCQLCCRNVTNYFSLDQLCPTTGTSFASPPAMDGTYDPSNPKRCRLGFIMSPIAVICCKTRCPTGPYVLPSTGQTYILTGEMFEPHLPIAACSGFVAGYYRLYIEDINSCCLAVNPE